MSQPILFRDADDIEEQARRIMYVARSIMEACQAGRSLDPHARNKVMSGGLAADAAVLAIQIDTYEKENA